MRAHKFVNSYLDAWNDHDARGIADHLAADGIYCDVPENAERSRDELIASLEDFFADYRHGYELIGEVLTGGDTIAYQYEMVPGKDGRHSNTYQGADFITLHDDRAVIIIDYYDVPGVGRSPGITQAASAEIQALKYAKSGLRRRQLARYQERLETIMQTEQLYLRPDMTLPRLAEAVDCSVNHLSQVINAGLGMSFFDYVNQYRIAYAKKLLTELDTRNSAVLNVAFDVGFNSNSAFYAAFKKCVGQTPAQYRKSQCGN